MNVHFIHKKKKKKKVQKSKLNKKTKGDKTINSKGLMHRHHGYFGLFEVRPFCSLFPLDFSHQIGEIAFLCA